MTALAEKPFWASKTLWVNGLALVASVGAATGYDFGLTPEAQASVVAGIMSIVNIALRLMTTGRVTAKKPAASKPWPAS